MSFVCLLGFRVRSFPRRMRESLRSRSEEEAQSNTRALHRISARAVMDDYKEDGDEALRW